MALMMKDMLLTESCFTHVDEHTGRTTVFAADRLSIRARSMLLSRELNGLRIPIEPWFAAFCRHNRGVEQHRLSRLSREHLSDPMVFCQMEDGTQLLVDGTHRYVRHHELGLATGVALLLQQEVWRDYVVVDAGQVQGVRALADSFSGIL